MSKEYAVSVVEIIVFSFIMTLLGGVIGVLSLKVKGPMPALAYGLNEKEDVLNRIRVDDKGHVICSKE